MNWESSTKNTVWPLPSIVYAVTHWLTDNLQLGLTLTIKASKHSSQLAAMDSGATRLRCYRDVTHQPTSVSTRAKQGHAEQTRMLMAVFVLWVLTSGQTARRHPTHTDRRGWARHRFTRTIQKVANVCLLWWSVVGAVQRTLFWGQTLPLLHTHSQFPVISTNRRHSFCCWTSWRCSLKMPLFLAWRLGVVRLIDSGCAGCVQGSCELTGDVHPHPQHILSLRHRFSEGQHLPGDSRAQSGKTIRFSCWDLTHCGQRHYETWGESFSLPDLTQAA